LLAIVVDHIKHVIGCCRRRSPSSER